MGLGLILLTIGARLIPAAEVALITLLEVVLGPLWVWISIFGEAGAVDDSRRLRGDRRRADPDDGAEQDRGIGIIPRCWRSRG